MRRKGSIMTKSSVSGLDLGPTLAWYLANVDVIKKKVFPVAYGSSGEWPVPDMPYEQEHGFGRLSELNSQIVASVLRHFPVNARKRMVLGDIKADPSLWFHRDSATKGPTPTTDKEQALSPTAIIPSYVAYGKDGEDSEEWCGFTPRITLFSVPTDIVPNDGVRYIVHLEGLVHELAHAILAPELYSQCMLHFPGVRSVRAHSVSVSAFVSEAEAVVNECGPISHYASVYYGEDGKLRKGGLTPINEALAEAIAAYLLGFAFRLDGTGLDPFAGRERLRNLVHDYLHASRTIIS